MQKNMLAAERRSPGPTTPTAEITSFLTTPRPSARGQEATACGSAPTLGRTKPPRPLPSVTPLTSPPRQGILRVPARPRPAGRSRRQVCGRPGRLLLASRRRVTSEPVAGPLPLLLGASCSPRPRRSLRPPTPTIGLNPFPPSRVFQERWAGHPPSRPMSPLFVASPHRRGTHGVPSAPCKGSTFLPLLFVTFHRRTPLLFRITETRHRADHPFSGC
ncbi:WAS/WASL-interacting protein family member 3-like [Canis lupus familiaris]|uniref:WAS/WASL-interacting protein family member 3-like n=1 Tax=Canis lupus familiaris TaxID=9615 RepID=UPI0015F172D2|nr:WAS/WASL-interacting protein family member 3-like [Canis lupus familiaris]